jgi:ABC-type lipoprotein release transport system permease subunit
MQTVSLIRKNLSHYWRTNLAVISGVAVAVAVFAGALLTGDSVRGSLSDLFISRMGRTDYVISGSSFFRERLADDIASHRGFAAQFADACPMIVFEGSVAHEKSGHRGGGIQVYGIDDRFWKFHGIERTNDNAGDVFLSASLAEELGASTGDSVLLTLKKPSAIPAESLHGRKDEPGRVIRLTVKSALASNDLGDFSIKPQQGPVRAVFLPLRKLQRDLEQPARVNAILVSQKNREASDTAQTLEVILKEQFQLEDLGIKVRALDKQNQIAAESQTAILSDSLADTIRAAASSRDMKTFSVLTYLANAIRSRGREVPYSVVTALDGSAFDKLSPSPLHLFTSSSSLPPIILNQWAATDLGAKTGDQIELEYYVWAEEGRLITERSSFTLAGIVPIEGAAADRDLVPDYPGITGTESIGDWDPPFPMNLGLIRKKDEDYWDAYRATPKAFVTLEAGQKIWQSRYGRLTSIRILPDDGTRLEATAQALKEKLRASIDPLTEGLSATAARAEGLRASRGATDFGEYFAYFSFFLMASALLLTALFFRLGIEQRLREIGLLEAIGFSSSQIRSLFLREGFVLAVAGSLLGVVLAIGYGWLMMLGLRTWWVDAVGTRLLALHLRPASLVYGAAGGVISAMACIAWTIRSLRRSSPRSLLSGSMSVVEGKREKEKGKILATSRVFAYCLLPSAFCLVALAWAETISQTAGFFGAGVFLLTAFLIFESSRLRSSRRGRIGGQGLWSVSRLGFRNITWRPARSLLCVTLIASATFIIFAVEAFRRDDSAISLDPAGGTGGFSLMAESFVPVISDPNTDEGKESLNLSSQADAEIADARFYRFRLRPGEDASCLNLYQPSSPRILAPTADFILSSRFSFQSSLAASDDEKENPWLLLESEPADGAIPVIADSNSLTYVLHLRVGDEFLMARSGGSPLRLRVVGALADSIFQSELLMSEANFKRVFPQQEGYRFFLIETSSEKSSTIAALLEDRLSDFGIDAVSTVERLASYHRVENTYLSTFQTLGGLGLMLGTLGLATVLLRNTLERRRELALLKAVGYKVSHFSIIVVAENALMLVSGLAIGALSSLVAIAPALMTRGALSLGSLSVMMAFVIAIGLLSSIGAVMAAARSPLLEALRAE